MNKLMFVLTLALGFSITSCTDPCKETICNFGFCDDGTCECDQGYTGTSCETEQREVILGDWQILDFICDGTPSSEDWIISIVKGPLANGVQGVEIFDKDHPDDRMPGVFSNDVITITDFMYDSPDELLNATYTLTNGTLIISSTYTEPGEMSTCTGTATRL